MTAEGQTKNVPEMDLETQLMLLEIELGVKGEGEVAVDSMRTVLDTLGVPTDSIDQPDNRDNKTAHTTQTVGPNDEDDY